MYLQSSNSVDEVIVYGIKPAIEFLHLAQDAREDGDDDRAAMLELEARAKLYEIKEVLKRIDRVGRGGVDEYHQFTGGIH